MKKVFAAALFAAGLGVGRSPCKFWNASALAQSNPQSNWQCMSWGLDPGGNVASVGNFLAGAKTVELTAAGVAVGTRFGRQFSKTVPLGNCCPNCPRTPPGCEFSVVANPGWLAIARTPPACKRPARRAGRRLAPGGAQATPGVFRSTPTAPRRGARIIWTAVPRERVSEGRVRALNSLNWVPHPALRDHV